MEGVMDEQKQVRVDVMYRCEPDAATRELIARIERMVADSARATGEVARVTIAVGARSAPQDVRAAMALIA